MKKVILVIICLSFMVCSNVYGVKQELKGVKIVLDAGHHVPLKCPGFSGYHHSPMEVVDNASDENNENTRRKATVVPIKIEYV